MRVHACPVRAEGTWAGGWWDRSSAQPVLPGLCSWADPSLRQVLKSHGQDYLVGNKLSRADIQLVELLYYVEELDPSLLANFPLLKVSSVSLGLAPSSPLGSAVWTLGLPWQGPHHCAGLLPPGVQPQL